METEKATESLPRKRTRIKVAVVFLIIFSIGQFSAILIPALTGQSPKPTSIFGSILWPSLLFMAVWSLNGKMKLKGLLLGLCIGFTLHIVVGATAGYKKAEERTIDKA